MEIFDALRKPKVVNFLNKKTLLILRTIKENPSIFVTFLKELLMENKVEISTSQIYRYINTLKKHNLIMKHGWSKRPGGFGYSYDITKEGELLLESLSDIFVILFPDKINYFENVD